jgi:hypothetical protein
VPCNPVSPSRLGRLVTRGVSEPGQPAWPFGEIKAQPRVIKMTPREQALALLGLYPRERPPAVQSRAGDANVSSSLRLPPRQSTPLAAGGWLGDGVGGRYVRDEARVLGGSRRSTANKRDLNRAIVIDVV